MPGKNGGLKVGLIDVEKNTNGGDEMTNEQAAGDAISRQEAIAATRNAKISFTIKSDIDFANYRKEIQEMFNNILDAQEKALKELPSAQPDYQEVLGWLLAYHTMSFDLHGRYLPHEVISWLINDFTKGFIAERRTDGN